MNTPQKLANAVSLLDAEELSEFLKLLSQDLGTSLRGLTEDNGDLAGEKTADAFDAASAAWDSRLGN